MPSYVTHAYFATEVINDLDIITAKLIVDNLSEFIAGAQGPDTLFYLRFNKSQRLALLGERMHISKEVFNFFKNSFKYAKKNNEIIPYVCGQITHYALDKTTHPYIYYRENDLKKYYPKNAHKNIHQIFETGLDYLIIEKYMGIKSENYKAYRELHLDYDSKKMIKEYFKDVVSETFRTRINDKDANQILRRLPVFMQLVHSEYYIKYYLYRIVEKLLAKGDRYITALIRPRNYNEEENWLNEKRMPYPRYRNKIDIYDNHTFEELMNIACKSAVKMINNFLDFLNDKADIDESLYDCNYAGDLFIK